MKKRLFALLLTLCMVLSVMPALSLTVNAANKVSVETIIANASSLIDKYPYVWGGESPEEGGFDCTGFVWYVYNQMSGVDITLNQAGRSKSALASAGTKIYGMSNFKPGDIVQFNYPHVAIYIGDSTIIEAQKAGTMVHKRTIDDSQVEYAVRLDQISTCKNDHSSSSSYETVKKSDGSYAAVCKECGYEYPISVDTSAAGKYKIKSLLLTLNSAPYEDAQTSKTVLINTQCNIVGSCRNAYGNLWYKTDDGYWIYKDYLTLVSLKGSSGNASVSAAEGTYYIYAYCGKVVEVENSGKNNGANVQIWDLSARDLDCQKFKIVPNGSYYKIINVNSGKAVDVNDNATTAEKVNIQQYNDNGCDAQKWKFEDAGGGYVYIRSALGVYMEVYNGNTSNGTNIWSYSFNGSDAQKFKLVPISVTGSSSQTTQTPAASSSAYESTILLDPCGGDVSPTSFGINYGSYWTLPTPTRSGYTFDGWYSEKNGGGSKYSNSEKYWGKNETKTVYANWVKIADASAPVITSLKTADSSGAKTSFALGEEVLIVPEYTGVKYYFIYLYRVENGKETLEKSFTMGYTGTTGFTPENTGSFKLKIVAYGETGATTEASCTFTVSATETETGTPVNFENKATYRQGQFTDVPASQWFTDSVAEAFSIGLMKGNSNTTFNPYGDVTLAEAITMAARIHSIYTTGTEKFDQSAGGVWYRTYLDYAYEKGVISNAYYNADVTQKATRAQFAEIFAKALPKEALYGINKLADGVIPDVDMSKDYASSVYLLYRAGILTGGDANGTFSPQTFITRAESAAIVARMARSSNRKTFTL
ncbi:MAG: RICIN domain-containing protein [Clostridia bacterium]|nr:RICIN domain-containing protein [Clostridia bacterium]